MTSLREESADTFQLDELIYAEPVTVVLMGTTDAGKSTVMQHILSKLSDGEHQEQVAALFIQQSHDSR